MAVAQLPVEAAEPGATPVPSSPWRRVRLQVGAFWALVSAMFVIGRWSVVRDLALTDSDDFMRLAQVRSWLAGQSWWDRTAYRLDPPGGLPLHFSRLGDVGVGLLDRVLSPLLGERLAEQAALIGYPLALFAVLVGLIAALAGRLGGPRAALPSAALLLTAPLVLVQFFPGRIDHHGLQLVLVLALLYTLTGPASVRSGALAGAFAALSLAIGLETAPYLAAAWAVVGLRWVLEGRAARPGLWGFAAGFGLGTPLLLAATVRPGEWGDGACTSLASAHAVGAAAVSGAFALVSALGAVGLRGRARRLAAALAAAGAGGGLVLAAFPACRSGAYGQLDPLVRALWLDNVLEARSLPEFLRVSPQAAMAVVALLVSGALFTLLGLRRADPERRSAWAALLLFLAAGAATTAWQVRGAYLALAFATAPIGCALGARRHERLGRLRLRWAALAALAGQLVAALGAGQVLGQDRPSGPPAPTCSAPAELAPLAAAPLGRVLAPIDLGSPLLVFTPHEVLAAPYPLRHPGILDQVTIQTAPEAEAAALLARREIDTVLVCPGSPESHNMTAAAPDGLVARLERNDPPAWLTPLELPADTPVRAYRVERGRLPLF